LPQIVRVRPDSPDAALIREAAGLIRRGLVVAYPTDTLYGLAVDPRNSDAVRRLYELKGRAETSALTLIAADLAQVRAAAEMTTAAERLASRWWPGPLTIVLRARDVLAREILAGGFTVGIRVPDHAVAVALARELGFAITATSANRSGMPAATEAAALAAALPDVDAIIDAGPVRGGAPSTLVDASSGTLTLLRDGAVAWSKVLEFRQ
jgi:tRNA threonylcarbamoyl adenosine modification protein (Sua5/YciO/YrdC/YwlC family)